MKKYQVTDNGGLQFVVYKYSDKIEVYNDNMDLLLTIGSYEKVFTPIMDKDIDGPVLIKIRDNKYIYISYEVYLFDTINNDEIIEFYPNIGNSGVFYAYCIGEKYTYLLIENEYIPNEKRVTIDPYDHYYNHHKLYKNNEFKDLLYTLICRSE